MLDEEGLTAVYAGMGGCPSRSGPRPRRRNWNTCRDPAEYSSMLTAIVMPEDAESDDVLSIAFERFRLSLGVGSAA